MKRWMGWLAVGVFCLAPALAGAATITRIGHFGTHCGAPSPSLNPCASSLTGDLPILNRADPNVSSLATLHIGGGTVTANEIAFQAVGNNAFHRLEAGLEDNYLLTGAAGSVSITARLRVQATAVRLPTHNGAFGGEPFGNLSISGTIGESLFPGSGVQNVLASGSDSIPTAKGPLTKAIDFTVVATRTVSANTPFTFAFDVTSISTNGMSVNALNTVTIDFDIPTGYTLSSDLGWSPVPEPGVGLLAALGGLGLGLYGRRRRPARR